jgi:hypothetical protein
VVGGAGAAGSRRCRGALLAAGAIDPRFLVLALVGVGPSRTTNVRLVGVDREGEDND